MLKVMLIAGDVTEDLSVYFNERGTLRVERKYKNLSGNYEDINGKIIDVDKLVYVYSDKGNMNIKKDMGTLKKLLKEANEGTSFFNVKEINFFLQKTEHSDQVLKFFNSAMKEVDYTNISIHESTQALTFIEVYNHLLGTSENNKIVNKHMQVVRKPKGSQIRNVYDPKKTNVSIEPFKYDHIENYEKAKDNASKLGLEVSYHDDNVSITKFDKPYLGSLELENIFGRRNIYITSGLPRTGISTNTAVLAYSSTLANKSVTVVNTTQNNDTQDYLKEMGVKFTKFSMKKFVLTESLEHKNLLNLVNLPHNINDVRKEALGFILSNSSRITSDIIIIETDKDMLDYVLDVAKFRICRILFSCETLEKDINNLFSYINNLATEYDIVLMLTELLREMKHCRRLTHEKIRERFNGEVKIMQPVRYDDFEIDALYYEQLIKMD